MIRKNVSGQHIYFAMVVASTGAADTGATVTVKVSIDGGSQGSGSGTVTNLGNGQYSYAMTQGETNGNQIGFLFTATSDVPVSLTVCTTAADLTNGNNLGLVYLPQSQMAVKKNQALANFMFPMYDATGSLKPGLGTSVTVQRALDGGAVTNATNNPAAELGSGLYTISLSAGDTNGKNIAFIFSAPGAQSQVLIVVAQD